MGFEGTTKNGGDVRPQYILIFLLESFQDYPSLGPLPQTGSTLPQTGQKTTLQIFELSKPKSVLRLFVHDLETATEIPRSFMHGLHGGKKQGGSRGEGRGVK